jgi:hypothetical protein
MRIGSTSVLVLAAFALSACTGGSLPAGIDTLGMGSCTLDTCPPNPDNNSPPAPPAPPVVDPDDPDNTNTGNPTNLLTGDMTLVLENGVLKSPTGGSLSRLTLTANTAPILDTARIEIDTNTANNSSWPVPKTMNEYEYGTNASGGVGLGADYKEYRVLNGSTSDEVLQVWTWSANSYATQYREEAGSGNARRQAWSFGGIRTASMPAGGSADYVGTFGGTATTSNWVETDNPGQTINTNNVWRVEGDSNIHADFTTRQLTGTLSANTWMAREDTGPNIQAWLAVDVANGFADPNFQGFMDDDVVIQGQITGNTVTGTASLNPLQGWSNGQNPMYAGFFGPQGAGTHEVAGTYNFLAQSPDPVGGDLPHNDPAKGFVQQSGIFHGCNTACPP